MIEIISRVTYYLTKFQYEFPRSLFHQIFISLITIDYFEDIEIIYNSIKTFQSHFKIHR